MRPADPVKATLQDLVSIHAPVKGATPVGNIQNEVTEVSIHAPVKGATRSARPPDLVFAGFNPRTREGCDFSCAV